MPIILIRNIDPKNGLCNGVRLVVVEMVGNRLIVARTLISTELHYIPRINLIVEESENAPFKCRRRQFTIKPAFALTINKSEGQSLDRVLIWLWDMVFSHGQLYVAASRIRDPMNIKFFIRSDDEELKTKNIVYTDILI